MKASSVHGPVSRDDLDRSNDPVAILVLAILVAFCLSTIIVAGTTAGRLGSALETRLSGQVTVAVWGQGLESVDAAAARAAELLFGQVGVRHATVLEADASDSTIGALVSSRPVGVDPPRLVALSGSPEAMPISSKLRKLLNANGLTATIDDHRGRGGPLETWALVASGLGIVAGIVLCGVLLTGCLVAGSKAVGSAYSRFELMTRLGADPAFIGAMVSRRIGMMALAGGVLGTIAAAVILLAFRSVHGFWSSLGALGFFQPQPSDAVGTAAIPLVVTAIAAFAAGLGARRAIRRRERRI